MPVLLAKIFEPFDCFAAYVAKTVEYVGDACVQFGYVFVCFINVETQDTFHLYFEQTQDIVAGHIAVERRFERLKAHVYVCDGGVEVRGIFIFLVLVYSFFDEDAFEGCEKQLFACFGKTYLQVGFKNAACGVHAVAEHIADTEEFGLLSDNHTAVRGYAYFAVCESIQCVYGFVA